jgi:hypothetical protein
MKSSVLFLLRKSSVLKVGSTAVLAAFVLCTQCLISSAQRVAVPIEQSAKVSEVKFMVPKGFRLEQSSTQGVALMRHEKEDLVLFVAVTKDQQVDDPYLIALASGVVSQLIPQEQGFAWKVSRRPKPKMSARQTIAGIVNGLNDSRYVQTDFVVVKSQRHEIVLGAISTSHSQRDVRYLFDAEGYEYSFTGWEGLFKLIPSVTGEKYD